MRQKLEEKSLKGKSLLHQTDRETENNHKVYDKIIKEELNAEELQFKHINTCELVDRGGGARVFNIELPYCIGCN